MNVDYIFGVIQRKKKGEEPFWKIMNEVNEKGEEVKDQIKFITSNPDLLSKIKKEISTVHEEDWLSMESTYPTVFDPIFLKIKKDTFLEIGDDSRNETLAKMTEGHAIFHSAELLADLIREERLGKEEIGEILFKRFGEFWRDGALVPLHRELGKYYQKYPSSLFEILHDEFRINDQLRIFGLGLFRIAGDEGRGLFVSFEALLSGRHNFSFLKQESWYTAISFSLNLSESLTQFLEEVGSGKDFLHAKLRIALNITHFFSSELSALQILLEWIIKHLPESKVSNFNHIIARNLRDFAETPDLYQLSDQLLGHILVSTHEESMDWYYVQIYLKHRCQHNLEEGKELIFHVFLPLIFQNPGSISRLNVRELFTHFNQKQIDDWASDLLRSDVVEFTLFAIFLIGCFISPKVGSKEKLTNENTSNIILLSFRYLESFLSGGAISRFLMYLDSFLDLENRRIAVFFKEILYQQALSYPGECLDSWKSKKLADRSVILNNVIEDAEKYYQERKGIEGCQALEFEFPGFREIQNASMKGFYEKIRNQADQNSIASLFASRVDVIYGSGFDYMDNDRGPTELSTIRSSSPEISRRHYFHPEEISQNFKTAQEKLFSDQPDE